MDKKTEVDLKKAREEAGSLTIPDMESECNCGHLFEEHDWGAFYIQEANCLVEGCSCVNFKLRLEV